MGKKIMANASQYEPSMEDEKTKPTTAPESLRYKLNTGSYIPAVGFGTVALTDTPDVVKAGIRKAIQVGYRHFDTSAYYGTEALLGEVLKEAFENSDLKREDVFVTTKLWMGDCHKDGVLPALQKSLKTLQLECVDLYLIHWPLRVRKNGTKHKSVRDIQPEDFLPLDLVSTWHAMEKCRDLGLAKAIGVSNFSAKKLENLLPHVKYVPSVNQVEMHPTFRQSKLRDFCKRNGIQVIAWAPLAAPGVFYGVRSVIESPVIKDIAVKHGKTPAQVALRWGIENGVCVIPKSYNESRIIENFGVQDWSLTEQDHEGINSLPENRMYKALIFCNDTTSPYRSYEDLWDEPI
ncbi:hypothetical protein R1sor_006679 [Riccia sorocarpa]|uniref:NADP-dependent oxidoreductase domain-containing protein n=1 Tax=Riccia sorocarpa TaxID=122646 RepID=A0ABD3HNQ9_9MARC